MEVREDALVPIDFQAPRAAHILRAVNLDLFLMGIAQVGFGVVVGAVGIFVATRLLGWLLGWGVTDAEIKKGNVATGILKAASILSLGILAQHAVQATFAAIDLSFRGEQVSTEMVLTFLLYGSIHVAVAFAVGSFVLWFGAWLFTKLTRGVDEMDEVKKGNVAPALVLGAVLVVLALATAPGLEVALQGLIPLPQLGRDEMIAP